MDQDLLKKEEILYKINKEIELKTTDVLKKYDHMMKTKNDNMCKASVSSDEGLTRSPSNISDEDDDPIKFFKIPPLFEKTQGKKTTESIKDDVKLMSKFAKLQEKVSRKENAKAETIKFPKNRFTSNVLSANEDNEDEDDDVLPRASRGMGAEHLVRLLKAKVRSLQKELEVMGAEYSRRTEEHRKGLEELTQTKQEAEKWAKQVSAMKETQKKRDLDFFATANKLQHRETEVAAQRKELESLKKDLKLAQNTSKLTDVRFNRATEEIEKLKAAIKTSQQTEKEMKDSRRLHMDEISVVIRKLEKQKNELAQGFKKQMQLIDNLKNQKVHLEGAHSVQFSEEEFCKLLDWQPSKIN